MSNKWLTSLLFVLFAASAAAQDTPLLNVSYDATREFYQQYNLAFKQYWQQKTGQTITVRQSHGGSGKQAIAVINGMAADVVTLALAYDIDMIAKNGYIAQDWHKYFPNNSTPYTSTIVFLVRKGNPKQIHDWPDLIKPDIAIITPNPKTSGGARWNYLAAWGYALRHNNFDQAKAQDFVQKLYNNVRVLDVGARAASNTFIERGIGDVLIAWENEAMLAAKKVGKDRVEIITPTESILTEPSVALVDKTVDKRGTRKIATAYLNYLYSPQGQRIASKNFYRPANTNSKLNTQFPKITLFSIKDTFGNWALAQKTHFSQGGTFDKISLH